MYQGNNARWRNSRPVCLLQSGLSLLQDCPSDFTLYACCEIDRPVYIEQEPVNAVIQRLSKSTFPSIIEIVMQGAQQVAL
jgi:hypothetical protein